MAGTTLEFAPVVSGVLVTLLGGGVFGIWSLSMKVEGLRVSQDHLRADLEIFRGEIRAVKEEVKQ